MGSASPARRAYRGRTSRQREALAEAADAIGGAFSAEELQTAAERTGAAIGTATVYRAVAAMQEAGFIEAVGNRSGAVVYARCRAEGHHHHLVCESCGRVQETPCMLPDRITAPADGFEVRRHALTLYGLCASCASQEKGR